MLRPSIGSLVALPRLSLHADDARHLGDQPQPFHDLREVEAVGHLQREVHRRIGAGVGLLEINSGTTGTLRDLKRRFDAFAVSTRAALPKPMQASREGE